MDEVLTYRRLVVFLRKAGITDPCRYLKTPKGEIERHDDYSRVVDLAFAERILRSGDDAPGVWVNKLAKHCHISPLYPDEDLMSFGTRAIKHWPVD
jgi:hypothetical protein